MLGGILFLLLLGIAVFGYFYGANLYNVQTRDVRLGPSAKHLFGTDNLGRDILDRLLYGAHLTIGCGICIVLLAALLGIPLGLSAAWFGGKFDSAVMRTMDIILAFPSILLAMACMAALGFNMRNIILAIALVYIPKFARVVRASALVEKSMEYAQAARASGAAAAGLCCFICCPTASRPCSCWGR